MRKNLNTVIMASALAVALLSGTALYAHQSDGSQGSMMGQMSQMMATCNQMMQGMMQHHQEKLPKHDQGPENKN
jgi:hypothetical protein